MSIYDRAYMNEDEPGGGGRSAVGILIVINIAIWVLWQFAGAGHDESSSLATFMNENFTVSLDGVVSHFRFHTLITSEISHQDLMHILWNMLFFWFLADEVERVYGKLNFYWLYVFCGVTASLAHIGSSAMEMQHGLSAHAALGASGAIMGIAVVAAIFDPNRPVNMFGFITLPLKWLVGIYVLMDLYYAIGIHRGSFGSAIFREGAIAYFAHLGGALGGYAFWRLDLRLFQTRGRRQAGWINRFRRWLKRSEAPPTIVDDIPRELPGEPVAQRAQARMAAGSSRRASGRSHVDAATSARVDELLSKISREGMGALTDEERRFLQESSQKYKK
jgi:membrane associated rhomboid family serine protease